MTYEIGTIPFDETDNSGLETPADHPDTPPDAALLASTQMVNLRTQESGQFVNIDSGGWAFFSGVANTKYVLVQYYDNHYIVIADGSYKNYYLSYNDRYYVGGYSAWSNARYWAVNPVDCSPYPGLYPYEKNSTSWMCCNGVKDAIDKLVTVVSY